MAREPVHRSAPEGTRKYKYSSPEEAYRAAVREIGDSRRRRAELNLSGYGLAALPPEIGRLTALQHLNLAGNQLAALPAEIGQLTALKHLDLDGNQLAALPAEIGRLTALEHLDLDGNQLAALPAEIGRLTALQRLNLNESQLAALPAEIGQLTALQYLYLDGNQLAALPAEIGQLTALKWLTLDRNPLPEPYPRLTAPDQPEATSNVLAYLRGELNPEILQDIEIDEPDSADIDSDFTPEELDKVLVQRPAAYRFEIRSGKLDALPEKADTIDAELARDLLAELKAKATALHDRLAQTNSDPRATRSVKRLLDALDVPFDQVRPGILLSRQRSVEADRDAFDSEEGRQQLFLDAIAEMNDVLLTLQDLLAVYPIVRRIEAERVALHIQGDPDDLAKIEENLSAIKEAAATSDAVTEAATRALRSNDHAIEGARTLDEKAGLIADTLLVARNFINEAARVVGKLGSSAVAAISGAGRQIGKELKDLGAESWKEAKSTLPKTIGGAANLLVLGGLIALLVSIAGPVAGLAAVLAGFKTLANIIKGLPKITPSPAPEKETDQAPKGTTKRKETKSRTRKRP